MRFKEAYGRARDCISTVVPGTLCEADGQLLSQAESNLDALVRSKQVDIHLGEMFALVSSGRSLLDWRFSLSPRRSGAGPNF